MWRECVAHQSSYLAAESDKDAIWRERKVGDLGGSELLERIWLSRSTNLDVLALSVDQFLWYGDPADDARAGSVVDSHACFRGDGDLPRRASSDPSDPRRSPVCLGAGKQHCFFSKKICCRSAHQRPATSLTSARSGEMPQSGRRRHNPGERAARGGMTR